MNNFIKTFLVLCFINTLGYGQNADPFSADNIISVKTPDVAAFESVSFLPVNEYTGRVAINIPVYTITLDGLSIPISISYNSGGVKVNSISSRVGLNWSLHAGGMISREIKGRDDIRRDYGIVENDLVFSEYGFLIENFVPEDHQVWEPGRDGQPDIFFTSAPGLNTTFTHRPDATPLELNPQGNKITTITEELSPKWYFFKEVNIISPKGFVYGFKDMENSHTVYNEYANEDEIGAIGGHTIHTFSSSIHLSSITNPVSNRAVTFAYDSLRVEDHDLYTTRKYDENKSLISKKVFNNDYIDVQLIKKISFDTGEINFYYADDRLDLTGDKRLTAIEVVDNHGKLIKKVHFVQDYFASSDGCNEPECLRLKLSEIYFTDANGNILPGYKFTYDETGLLPKRRSYKQDFLGYSNGANSSSFTKFVPQVYYKADQGRNSILPFNIPGLGYQAMASTYSITSDVTYARSASLVEITYPTGGYAQLEYELNSFSFLGQEIHGGGLRLKTHRIFNDDHTLKRALHYAYEKEDGTTSGSMLFVPHWADFSTSLNTNLYLQIHQRSLNAYELTKNSYVGYSRVKVYESGNGYRIKTFSAPEDFPNSYPVDFDYTIGTGAYAPDRQAWLDKRVSNGAFPNLWQSNEIKRGNLLSETTYDQADNLLKKVEHQYAYTPLDSISIHDNLYYPDGYTYYDDPFYIRANSFILSERNVLAGTLVTDYLDNGAAITKADYFYDDENSFLTEKHSAATGGKTIKEKYYYPYSNAVASLAHMDQLIDLNIIEKPVQTEVYQDDELLSTTRTYYHDWGNGRILPDSIASSFSNEALEIKGRFHNYDAFGNPLELSREDGIPVSYIWGYWNTKLIAKLERITYADINPADIISLKLLSDNDKNSTSEQSLRDALDALRDSYPDAVITTFTHDPLIGITSITDPRRHTSFYFYDGFNRLEIIKDFGANIISDYWYHYNVSTASLNTDINYGTNGNDHQWFIAGASGGSGDYSYAWYKGIGASSTDFEGTPSGTAGTYQLMTVCDTAKYVKLVVTDNITGETAEATKTNNNSCNYAPLSASITYGPANDTSQWFFSNVSGGSGDYSYAWYDTVGNSFENTPSSTASFYQMSVPCTTLKNVKLVVTDTVTGESVIKIKVSNNSPCTGDVNEQ